MKPNNLYLNSLLLIILMAFFVIESIAQAEQTAISSKCGFSIISDKDKSEKLLRHVSLDTNDLPAVSHKIIISPNNLFAIHYDTTGVNAPSPIDLNHNGISDYVDSVCYYFERAYFIQVDSIGYKSPYPDNGGRGTPQYDVYLWDLGNSDADTSDANYDQGGYYGYTMWQDTDQIYPISIFPKTYSYIVIDNDFSPTDSVRPKSKENIISRKAFTETGINALKITASHEFQHAVQLMYGNPSAYTIMEMCGVAMEFRLYPESKDYIQYVSNIFKNANVYPFGVDNPQTGYGFSIFARYLIQNFGDKPLKRLWELVSDGIITYKALDSSLIELGTSFPAEWQKFLDWCYYTGSRAVEDKYFPDARQLPELVFYNKDNSFYSPPSISNSGNLRPLEIRALRFNFKGVENNPNYTLDIMLGNIDIKSAANQTEPITKYEVQVTGEQVDGSQKLEGINYYYKDSYDKQKVVLNKYGTIPAGIDYAYPNPYNINKDNQILFPAPENAELYDEADLNVYTSDMIPVYSEKSKVIAYNKHRVVLWDNIPADISNGIYIFGVRNKDNIKLGKFSVIRK
jgi:hypothetical protein